MPLAKSKLCHPGIAISNRVLEKMAKLMMSIWNIAENDRTPDKVHIFISIMPISLSNPMFDNLWESSHRDDSNKWSNIGVGKEITQ